MEIRKAEKARWTVFILLAASITVYAGNAAARDTLGRNEKLSATEELRSTNGGNILALQADGNLVAYDSRKTVLWSSGTMGSGAVECILQEDGNLLLKNANGKAVWASGTAGYKNSKLVMQNDGNLVLYNERGSAIWAKGITIDSLTRDEKLLANEFIRSRNGRHTLVLQTDGNLVAYDSQKKASWESHTVGSGAVECLLQGDGQLVLKDHNGRVVWATNTDGFSNPTLLIEDDGNVVLFKDRGIPFWSNGSINVNVPRDAPPADVPAAYVANTGDSEFDNALNDLNTIAYADLDNFINNLIGTFGISRPWVENLVKKEKVPPADVYMIVRTANVTNRPFGAIEKYYTAHRGQGWGVVAKQLGIKPGSKEFHSLKKVDTEMFAKGKKREQKKNNKDKS
ncbi:MAG: hypothetical protein ACYDH0_04575 [Candidatus Aminicenantales bacterium]